MISKLRRPCMLLCTLLVTFLAHSQCTIEQLPSVQYKGHSIQLSDTTKKVLNRVGGTLKQNPECNLRVSGHATQTKAGQQLSWDRVNAVIRYLIERIGISPSRLLFEYGTEGNPNTVDLQPTTDEGANTIPAPHPNLQRIKH